MTTRTLPSLGVADLLTTADLSPDTVRDLFDLATSVKANPRDFAGALQGNTVVLLFEKESLRTKLSFEIGLTHLGATPVYHDHQAFRIGERESVPDYARNLERWCDAIIARVYAHEVLEKLAAAASVPVVNALSEKLHPCQGLTDIFTLAEHVGDLSGARIAYIGDGNNVCHSLMLAAAATGVSITVIAPDAYAPEPSVIDAARAIAAQTGASVAVTPDLADVENHTAVYTDAWVSMGFEAEAAQRHVALAQYQVTPDVMRRAGKDALFMHCLPAHRGFEVSPDVIDSPQSIVFDQAENRLHVQKAILLALLAANEN